MGKKVLILSMVAAVLVFGGGLFTAYAMFDAFKSPKTVYLEAESKTWSEFGTKLSDAIHRWKSGYLPSLGEPSESVTEISDLQLGGDRFGDDEAAAAVLDFLRDWSLSVHTKSDPGNERYLSEMVLSTGGERFVGFEAAVEETRIGFRVKDILDKYVVLDLQSEENNELPKRIVSTKDILDAVRISKEEIRPILADYVGIYIAELKDSQVALNKDAVFTEKTATATSSLMTWRHGMPRRGTALSKRERSQRTGNKPVKRKGFNQYPRSRA